MGLLFFIPVKGLCENGSRCFSNQKYAVQWQPDAEELKQFDGPIMYPDEVSSTWIRPLWNAQLAPIEKSVKNITLNFGLLNPAARGVLRLLLNLDEEAQRN